MFGHNMGGGNVSRPNDVNPVLNAVSPHMAQMFAGVPTYSTQQADQSRNQNVNMGRDHGNAQGQLELNRAFDDLRNRQNAQLDYDKRAGYTMNAAANAGSARRMAEDTARQLNNMYATSAGRLLNAAQGAQAGLAGSTQALAGMFR